MEIQRLEHSKIIVVQSDEIIIHDPQSALDFMMNLCYGTEYTKIVLDKVAIAEDFFDLRTKLAGEVMQKLVNYHISLAIVGDFSQYSSKSFNDFVYETNKGNHLFLVESKQLAIDALERAIC